MVAATWKNQHQSVRPSSCLSMRPFPGMVVCSGFRRRSLRVGRMLGTALRVLGCVDAWTLRNNGPRGLAPRKTAAADRPTSAKGVALKGRAKAAAECSRAPRSQRQPMAGVAGVRNTGMTAARVSCCRFVRRELFVAACGRVGVGEQALSTRATVTGREQRCSRRALFTHCPPTRSRKPCQK